MASCLLWNNNEDDINDLRSHFLSSGSALTISHSFRGHTLWCHEHPACVMHSWSMAKLDLP